ncbi:5'-deoxynucleotidase [Alicyclobacillus herbarius]|uniref:5'-deoxynucleotidase n=1 Tax=Alicyclobacillus herbarius TaxID=122960 RepID=UPI000478FF31|nr:5'-deoxynucleotidase [Alicyclobacillus herbarius]
MQSVFFALLHRLRSTMRWSGMMALQTEDVAQHCFGVALIAHALCVIDEVVYGQKTDVGKVIAASLYHDASEAILTDVVAPVKKYNDEVAETFARLEHIAEKQLLDTLPQELQAAYTSAFDRTDEQVASYVHAADKLDALCKCKLEVRRGNQEFAVAARQIEAQVQAMAESMPAVQYFMERFLPAFEHSIDEYRYLQ